MKPTTLFVHLYKRHLFKGYLFIKINLCWILWYLKNSEKVDNICRILDNWNKEIPNFSVKFPYFNRTTFINNYKYWIHWITRMDPRERHVFNNLNPTLLINDEEWLHLDLSTNDIPAISCSFYFPDYEWHPEVIFNKLEHLQIYLSIPDATIENLLLYIRSNVLSGRRSRAEENISKEQRGQPKLIIDEEGIRLSPEYLKVLKQK